MFINYHFVDGFDFQLVRQSYHSQHEIEKIKRAEKDGSKEVKHAPNTTGG